MDAARAIRVYEGVKDLMNKEQKGFVTPRVFNSFAQIAQLNVFHEMFDDVIDGRKLRAQGVDGSDGLSMYNEAVENLAFFKKDRTVSMSSGKAALPGDMYKLIGIRKESSNVLERVPFEIVRNNNDAAYILGSNLSTPTAAFPVAIVTDSIELFPTSITKAIVSYYRLPGCAGWQTPVILDDIVQPASSAVMMSCPVHEGNYHSLVNHELEAENVTSQYNALF